MDLIVKNHIIKTPIINILKQVKSELNNGKLKDIKDKHKDIRITCPFHKNGLEKNPSCGVYSGDGDLDLPPGFFHCFTCGESGPLTKLIGECFDADTSFGEEWLMARFGSELSIEQSGLNLKEIKKEEIAPTYLDESLLNNFQSYHPYMKARKLLPEVVEKYKIKYDPNSRNLLFPVWDENNHLITITQRSVDTKFFYLDENLEKPIYLLNFFKNSKEVYVCESQINTLTLIGYSLPSIALFGTGNSIQYNKLKKLPIKHYILSLDPDEAGIKGTYRFISNMPKDVFIDVLELPKGKDINDLSKEEFNSLTPIDSYSWIEKNKATLKSLFPNNKYLYNI